jgi:hypothetical protein
MEYPDNMRAVLAVLSIESIGSVWEVCFYSDGRWYYNATGVEVKVAIANICGENPGAYKASVVYWVELPPIPTVFE